MLREIRRLESRELSASHVAVELRTPHLRVGLHHGRNVASDFALLAQASSSFLDLNPRVGLTVVLDGVARFDESGRHAWLESGDVALADQLLRSTEAHAGERSRTLVLEWSPEVLGVPKRGRFEVTRLDARDRERLCALASEIEAAPRTDHVVEVVDVLRANGLPFERVTRADLDRAAPPSDHQALADAVGRSLSRLDRIPAIDELGDALGLTQRTLNRRLGTIAGRYSLSWAHWRSALHQARMISAIRLLAAPGATTELVARLTGFRSPTGLCHAFADAGLPSPGALAKVAARDVLAAWADRAAPPVAPALPRPQAPAA